MPRKFKEARESCNLITATDIVRVERYFMSGNAEAARSKLVDTTARNVVVKKYGLTLDDRQAVYVGPADVIFERMQEEYPIARQFTSFKAAKYAMQYGDPRSGEVRIIRAADVNKR